MSRRLDDPSTSDVVRGDRDQIDDEVLCDRLQVANQLDQFLWDLIEHPTGLVHVTVDLTRSGRGPAGVVVHRSAGIYGERR